VLPNLLVQTFAHSAEFLPRAFGKLLVDGEGDVHGHSICAHITRVKFQLVVRGEVETSRNGWLLLCKCPLDCPINFTNGIRLEVKTLIDDDSVTVDDIGAGDSSRSEERVCVPIWIPCEREGKVRMGLLKLEDSVLILLTGDGDEGEIGRGSVFLPDLLFQFRHLDLAGTAPCGPEVHHNHLACLGSEREGAGTPIDGDGGHPVPDLGAGGILVRTVLTQGRQSKGQKSEAGKHNKVAQIHACICSR